MIRAKDRQAAAKGRGYYEPPSSYDAGRFSRVDPDFNPLLIGPNALAEQTLDLARRRVRHLADNHPHIKAAMGIYCNNVVGESGIGPIADTPFEELNKQLKDRYYLYECAVNVSRNRTAAMMQRVICKEACIGGELLVHTPVVPAFGDEPAGPAYDLIPAEQIDLGYTQTLPNGNEVRQGVEFDAKKRIVAYHVMREHPADGMTYFGIRNDYIRIPATNATMMTFSERQGMIRGIPLPIAAVRTTRMQDGYQQANLQLALAIACHGIFFEGMQPSKLLAGKQEANYPYDLRTGAPVYRAEPGMIGGLPQGVSLKTASPTHPGPQYIDVEKLLARQMASACNVSYTQMTGDYGDTTFSSERARSLAERKEYRAAQQIMAHLAVRPLWIAFVRHQMNFGELTLSAKMRAAWAKEPRLFFQLQYTYPGWEWVNPQQEAQAAEIELALGVSNEIDVLAAKGVNFEDNITKQVKYRKARKAAFEEAGLELPGAAPVRPASDGVEEKSPNKKAQERAALALAE